MGLKFPSFVAAAVVAISLPALAQAPAKKPDAKARAAYQQMKKAQAEIATNADQIAKGLVPARDLLAKIRQMCHQRCQAEQFRCTMLQAAPNLPDFSGKAPRDFPIEIPDCNDPDCAQGAASTGAQIDCAKAKANCDKRCDCLGVS